MEVKTAQDTGLRTASPPTPKNDEMPLLGIDHIELYVGNAVQAAHFFTHALGFRETAFAGLETGTRDRSSRVVEQGRILFLLTAPLHGGSEIARHHSDQHAQRKSARVFLFSVQNDSSSFWI